MTRRTENDAAGATGTGPDPALPADGVPRHRGRWWGALAAVEVAIAIGSVANERVPATLVLVPLAAISLLIRRERFATLGFHRAEQPWRMAADVGMWVVVWTLVQLTLTMPVLERLTGERQDMSDFDGLEGDLGRLAVLLVLSWTLAAVGEELAYRGYVPTRVADLFDGRRVGVALGVVVSSVLFGLAHTEQGAVGIGLTFLDALFFTAMRFRHRNNLWASVLAHGFNNTLGLTAFYFVGPIHGLW